MKTKSILLTGIAAAALSGTALTTALADDYEPGGTLRFDDQAEQTRELNRASLEQSRETNGGQSEQADDDPDDGPAVVPSDGRDLQDDADDEDSGPVRDKDGHADN